MANRTNKKSNNAGRLIRGLQDELEKLKVEHDFLKKRYSAAQDEIFVLKEKNNELHTRLNAASQGLSEILDPPSPPPT